MKVLKGRQYSPDGKYIFPTLPFSHFLPIFLSKSLCKCGYFVFHIRAYLLLGDQAELKLEHSIVLLA
jgi:hypothetical protein